MLLKENSAVFLTIERVATVTKWLYFLTVPKDGLKNQGAFEEMRVNYIKELRRSVGKPLTIPARRGSAFPAHQAFGRNAWRSRSIRLLLTSADRSTTDTVLL